MHMIVVINKACPRSRLCTLPTIQGKEEKEEGE
jgi:hypothetical protein